MAFNFSALQFERGFQAKCNSNWEYPRFSPPRPRTLKKNSKPICDNNGHLLPGAKRDGNFLGHYRGTYHLPLRITRSFATLYNSCLSGRYKYWKYPRDLCCCQLEPYLNKCDFRLTLGKQDDPFWQKPECQKKCEGLEQMLAIEGLHKRCRRTKCMPHPNEKLIPRMGDSSLRNRKRHRKRPVTAFEYNRTQREEQAAGSLKTDDKNKQKTEMKDPDKVSVKSTAKSTTQAPTKPKAKS